ncbi:MAG: hypothetical protein QUS14_09985, partial [Pyrinomonadaceae bacterium]|nr:hypothetical protein [Pyrinomonadaceae bacterium]
RKICGILAETAETPKGLAVVVGIGINIRSTNFPPEIAETATSIEAESTTVPSVNELAERVSRYLIRFYDVLNSTDGPAAIRREWQQRSTYFSGKEVTVTLDNETFEGITDGLEDNGALRVALPDGSVRVVQAGDVRRVRRA